MYDRYRLIAAIATLFIFLLTAFPVQTIVTAILIAIAYFILRNLPRLTAIGISDAGNGREIRRRDALRIAKIYLSPYKDIWRDLKLSNKLCSVQLWADGETITAREYMKPKRSFRVMYSQVHPTEELWNMFCMAFSFNTSFDGLVQLCNTYQVQIAVTGETQIENNANNITPKTTSNNIIKVDADIRPKTNNNTEKIDINNASEVEITALPGISIVMAKKLVKKREEINGFKKVDDVILFLHVKPHIEKQLRELICVNKIKTSIKIKRNKERSVDL